MRAFKTVIVIVLGICFINPAYAGKSPSTRPVSFLHPQFTREYRGDIGNGYVSIGMSLKLSSDHKTARGTYFSYADSHDFVINAEIKDRSILIHTFDDQGKEVGQFRGEYLIADSRNHYSESEYLDDAIISGYYVNSDSTGERPFYLSLDFEFVQASGTNRYANAGFRDDLVVDQTAARVRDALLQGKRNVLAKMVRYPIKLLIDDQEASIDNAEAFVKHYGEIFHADFIESIRRSNTCHLLSSYDGVALASGKIWISYNADDTSLTPVITAINNARSPKSLQYK